jgi:hypothetical protein
MHFLQKMFSSDPSVSFGRLAAAIVLLFGLGWATFIVIHKLEVPSLQGVAAIVTSLYGSSKIGEVVSTLKGNGNGGDSEKKS